MEELRKQCMTWLERTNPLRGLSLSRASSIYDMARVYGSPRLQYMYNEIEQTDPVLLVCADRRESALAGLEWSFVPRANADQTLAQEQADALGRFADEIDNFGELLRHLDSAFFRGFAHAQPIWDGKGVSHVSLLDSWNFLTDRDGNWYWNPRCHETPSGLETVEDSRLVSLAHRRSIDYPALFIYIRKALGERDYGRFIERHGIPHAAVIMAPGTEEKDKPQYLAAANAWNNGQDIVLPNAAGINLATEARGTDPFTPFIDHQDKCIVLLATGGTLTSLAQADTGSLAGGAQMEVWREIVARDGVAVADALNRHLFRRYLELAFPGRPMAAKFTLSNEKKPTAGEIADLAVKIKSAGYTVDQAQLEEKTGLKLVKDEPIRNEELGIRNVEGLFRNKEVADTAIPQSSFPIPNSNDNLLEAFAKDTGPAADAIKALLKTIESGGDGKAEAATLIEKLPDLMPEDPAMSAVIAEAMAAEFAEVASGTDGRAARPAQPLANKEDQPRGKTTEDSTPGSFAPADGAGAGAAGTESPKAKAKREKHEWQVKADAQGNANLPKVKAGEDCPNFMPGLTISGGKKFDHIAFYQNDFHHINEHIQGDFGNGKVGFNHQAMLEGTELTHTMTQGTWYLHYGDYVAVEGKENAVVLSPDGKGLKITSTYKSSDKIKEITTGGFKRVFNKEDADDESHLTSAGV